MAEDHNPLADVTPAELHEQGLGYLLRSCQLFEGQPSAPAAASIAIACFFAAMSADSLAAAIGAHRDITPPHGLRPVQPAKFTGHHA